MIRESYEAAILKRLIRQRYLALGASPTQDQVDALAAQVIALGLGDDASRLVFDPSEYSESSARVIDKSLEIFNDEIDAIILSTIQFNRFISEFFDRTENKLNLIGQQASDQLLSACSLQVARQSGFSLTHIETFANLNKIDQNRTSVEIDLAANAATLPRQKNEERYDLTQLEEDAFDAFMINGSDARLSQTPGSRFAHVVDDSDSIWLQRSLSDDNLPKTMAFQMDMGEVKQVSRITFEPIGDDKEGSYLIRVLASKNAVNWREIRAKSRTISKMVDVSSLGMEARYIRIEMTREKPSYQFADAQGTYAFEFGLNNLRVYKTKYFPNGDFVSKEINFQDILGDAKRINRLKIDVFEEKPITTNITYYLARDPSDLGSALRITPGEIISLDTINEVDTDGKVRSRFDTNHALVNIEIPSDILPETVTFFRNTKQDGVLIDGVAAGWRLDNSYYNCVFEVDEDFEINLGINFAYIDGKKVNGIQVIEPGIHTFRTHETNWVTAESEDNDPLFPHNHKLLIEGLRGSSVYTGVDFQAADQLQLVSAFDLIYNIGTEDRNRFFGIYKDFPIVKIPKPPAELTEVEGWRSEQYSIRYKYPDAETPTRLVLIARLRTASERYTPYLKGFSVSAGY